MTKILDALVTKGDIQASLLFNFQIQKESYEIAEGRGIVVLVASKQKLRFWWCRRKIKQLFKEHGVLSILYIVALEI